MCVSPPSTRFSRPFATRSLYSNPASDCSPKFCRDLRRVGFYLREVGLDRAVEHEVAAACPPQVAAELRVRVVIPLAERGRAARRSTHGVRQLGIQLDDLAVTHAGQAREHPGLRD